MLQGSHEFGIPFFPIPGTKHVHKLEELLGSLSVTISEADRRKIRALLEKAQGTRYPVDHMQKVQNKASKA